MKKIRYHSLKTIKDYIKENTNDKKKLYNTESRTKRDIIIRDGLHRR
jgi:hypothetical protein